MKKEKKKSGIQRKYLRYTVFLLILALLFSGIGVIGYTREYVSGALIDKYQFLDEKIGIVLDGQYRKSDEVTAECIMDDDVQQSLMADSLEENKRGALSKYFAYLDLDSVQEYCYVDNNKNVYTRSYSRISYEDFADSGFADKLGDGYARTMWFWTEDTLFGTGEPSLFIGRYVRNMEYAHDPGMLFLRMDDRFLEAAVGSGLSDMDEDAAIGIVSAEGELCMSWLPGNYKIPEEDMEKIAAAASENISGVIVSGLQVKSGVLSVYRQAETGWIVFTLVPNQTLNAGLNQVLLVLIGIYLLVIAIAVVLSIYFSKRFTEPIRKIGEAMTGFDGNDFTNTIELHTNTELDEIGHAYNQMLENIERLLEEIKTQEKELHTSELNMLISQINPHFLYNTLDTIYMLARINKEETTMKMIQALSKYLRLSLSKGSDVVTVEDELENVKSYMEIQQIRNENLFRYEIDCQVDPKRTWTLKLILQPLVENAIKYGFSSIFEGGVIRIEVKMEESGNGVEEMQNVARDSTMELADGGKTFLIFCVRNSGEPMDTAMAEKINGLNELPLAEMKNCFPDKKRGYGVVNILTRLRLKYGDEVRLLFVPEEDGTSCIIKIPGDGREYEEL